MMKDYEVLKKYFGYESFREGQQELITNILERHDVLGIMPTGQVNLSAIRFRP